MDKKFPKINLFTLKNNYLFLIQLIHIEGSIV